jgi:hypothetical protein
MALRQGETERDRERERKRKRKSEETKQKKVVVITHTLMVKRASGIRIIFEFLEVDFVMNDGLVLVVHVDRFPGELDLVVADEQSVEVGHGAWQFVDA